MTHYVLFKFEDGFMSEEVLSRFERTYSKLKLLLPEDIKDYAIFGNCVERDSNMDMMVKIELGEKASLQRYLQHPEHTALISSFRVREKSRVSFDHE